MRSVSLGFARNLLLIGDGAAGFPSAFALDGPGLPRARWSQERSRFVQKGMLSRSPTGARPMFREQGGRGSAGRKRGRRSDRLQNAALKTTVGPTSPVGGRIAPPFGQQDCSPWDRRSFTKQLQGEESRAPRSFLSGTSNLSSMLIRAAGRGHRARKPTENRLRCHRSATDCTQKRSKPTSCRVMYLCCDGPIFIRFAGSPDCPVASLHSRNRRA